MALRPQFGLAGDASEALAIPAPMHLQKSLRSRCDAICRLLRKPHYYAFALGWGIPVKVLLQSRPCFVWPNCGKGS
eukprot:1815341-Alexandrium_andersonii.AAC.1